MFKKILLLAAIVFPMFAAAQNLKIGLVDVEEIFQKLPDTTEAQNKLAETSKKYEDEYAKLNDEMKRRYDEISSMSDDELPAIRERKIKDFQDYQMKIQQFEQSAAQELSRYQQELTAPIYQKIENAIQSVGKEENFSLILPKNSQMTLYFSDPVIEITNAVKAKLGVN